MAGSKRKRAPLSSAPKPLQHRHAIDADDASLISSKIRNKAPKKLQEEDKLISSKLSAKILKEALSQQREIAGEAEGGGKAETSGVFAGLVDAGNDDGSESDDFSETYTQFDSREFEIDPEDERILEAFARKDAVPQPTLADIIARKIKEKGAEVDIQPKLDQSIIELYNGVGKLLSRYTDGKIPKAFKHIPSLELWEDVLQLTDPANWSPCAMYQATRIFASNFGVKKAQRFCNLVLLPRVRDDIKKNKRLHDRYYQSLKKALYKPAAFFKGILFPLCQSGTCNLREAVIVGSIIQKVSIPRLHSGVALMKLAEMEYCGTTSYFIKLFLDKKHALPYRVLDAIVAHFVRFLNDERMMPVIWHQSLLSLVQRYKHELTKEDKENLDKLLQHQKHYLVTPEIRRELQNSRNRGDKEDDLMSLDILLCTIVTNRLISLHWMLNGGLTVKWNLQFVLVFLD